MNMKYLGKRIRALRDASGMKQQELAEILELKDRQSVGALESGTRRVTAAELVRLVNHFNISLEDISNPFLLSEREGFSWRQSGVKQEELARFERTAGEWIGAFRALSSDQEGPRRKLLPDLKLTHRSTFEDAVEKGELVADFLELGNAPAFNLVEAIEERLGILVLMVDAIPGVSGAACHLSELNAILINRNESPGRRRADLAHELFHILTWDVMKPERVEEASFAWQGGGSSRRLERNERIERLADNFGFGILLPERALDTLPEPKENAEWLNAAAEKLGVSGINLKWRLVNSKRVPGMITVPNDELVRLAKLNPAKEIPPLYSKRFLEVIGRAIETGQISIRRSTKLLGSTEEELAELFDVHGLDRPEELVF
ncbi:helix-turn-helix domain-containing protein [Brucella pseudogrignonensis]|uniref:helix-turn-helix domain-containing protein n=1 Tax=Brucella pseudogrignonensis TaxID=419475 RepID=UPI0038D0140B